MKGSHLDRVLPPCSSCGARLLCRSGCLWEGALVKGRGIDGGRVIALAVMFLTGTALVWADALTLSQGYAGHTGPNALWQAGVLTFGATIVTASLWRE